MPIHVRAPPPLEVLPQLEEGVRYSQEERVRFQRNWKHYKVPHRAAATAPHSGPKQHQNGGSQRRMAEA